MIKELQPIFVNIIKMQSDLKKKKQSDLVLLYIVFHMRHYFLVGLQIFNTLLFIVFQNTVFLRNTVGSRKMGEFH